MRGVLSPFYNHTRAPSGPIAPSHPQSGGKLVGFSKSVSGSVCRSSHGTQACGQLLSSNSRPPLCLLRDLSVFLVSHYGQSIPLFTHPLLSLASCLCPDMHPRFSKQMNLNRKGIQGLPNVVLLIPFFWSRCREQEWSSLCSILQNLCVGSTSMPPFAASSWNVAVSMNRVGQGREKQLGQYGVLVLLGFLFL